MVLARFSVVIPLIDDRDTGTACVRSWLTQTYPHDRFEIVVVTPTPLGHWERSLRAALRPHDQFLGPVAGNETALWDHGARQAKCDWLFFTEAHCRADRRCLEEMSAFLAANPVAGACCRSVGVADSALARLDERLFREGFEQAIRPDNWRKLCVHGCALDRRNYLQAGGFDGGFGRFGEWVLQRRLFERGVRLGYAERAVVQHVYRSSLAELIPQFVSYTAGECAFQAMHPDVRIDDFTCSPAEWRTGFDGNTSLARRMALDLTRHLLRGSARDSRWTRIRKALPTLLRLVLLSNRVRAAAAWLTMQAARWQTWRHRSDESALEPAYRRFNEAIVRWTRFRCLARHASPPPPQLAVGAIAVADLGDHALSGFHCLEQSAHGPFRWTRAVAGLEFHLTPGDYHVRLRTGGLRGRVRPRIRDVLFNGASVALDALADAGHDPVIPLQAGNFNDDGPQRLVLVSDPEWPADSGSSDRRELGVPILGLEIARAA